MVLLSEFLRRLSHPALSEVVVASILAFPQRLGIAA